eukprot:COSAG01_NODE_3210_length_6414_cov_54.271417_1_plen_73_part_00
MLPVLWTCTHCHSTAPAAVQGFSSAETVCWAAPRCRPTPMLRSALPRQRQLWWSSADNCVQQQPFTCPRATL